MQISVLIPLYNKRNSIQKALQSVLDQKVQPLEIVVVNDGSTDGSELLVEELRHPLIRLIHQPNAGVSAARNKGIEKSKGEWIALLDADDEWKPDYLETIEFLHKMYPIASLLATGYEKQDFFGNRKSIKLNKIQFTGKHGLLNNYFEVASSSQPPVCSINITLKKESIQNIGGFPLGIKSGEDLLTWARLAVSNKIAYSLKPQAVFIQDAAHTYDDKPNRIPEKPDRVGVSLIELYKENPKTKGLKQYLSHWFKMRSSIYLRLDNRKDSFSEALKSIRYNPLNYKVYIYIFLLVFPLSLRNLVFKKFGI